MINKIKKNCLDIHLDMTDEQIEVIINICSEDLFHQFGDVDEAILYELSLSTVRSYWVRFISQYSDNQLNKIIDCDEIIKNEKIKRNGLLKEPL